MPYYQFIKAVTMKLTKNNPKNNRLGVFINLFKKTTRYIKTIPPRAVTTSESTVKKLVCAVKLLNESNVKIK